MRMRNYVKRLIYTSITHLYGDAEQYVVGPVLRGPGRGLRLRVDLVDKQEGAYLLGRYDNKLLQRLRELIRPEWCVWDVGTYLGFYTTFFARAVGPRGVVVAIEPDPRNLDRTRGNVKLNNLNNVQFNNVAIGAPLGIVPFYLDEATNSHLPGCYVGDVNRKSEWAVKEQKASRIDIECITLDEAARRYPKPDIVKIDIEGAELDALRHCDKFVAGKPLIILELHNPECDEEAWNFSRRKGYDLYSLDTGKRVCNREDTCGTLLCKPVC